MAVSSSVSLAPLFGNLPFSEGGISTDYLVGAFIKSAAFANGVWTLTFQNSSGVEKTSILSPGWVVAAVEPSSPYEGQGWYDTTSNSLKLYNGTAFVSLTGTGTALGDGSVTKVKLKDGAVTPPKLDAGDATKQDAFLARLNALRRDLNNIATLTIAKQRTLLLATGTLIDGARPAPSAAYSGRTWIDDHDDRAYVCRNRQEVSSAVGGLWSDAATTTAGIEIAERLADLDDPASVDDYAYTYSDNKWWRGAVRNMQNVWRETQPTTALSGKLTLTPNWNTVWLGKHRWDYNATQQLPHSALPAMTDYYFYNTRTVTVRKLTLADYSAAGTVFDHWQWEPLVATAAEIDIIEARDGNLPALASDGTDDRQIAVANDGLHFVRLVPEAAVAATVGTWTSYVFSKSNPTRTYIGVVSTDDPASGTVGDFYYNSTFHRWRIYAAAGTWAWFNDHWEDLSDEDTAWPVRFVGHHATRAEAVAYAASSGIKTGETFVAFTGSEIETASQFNAGSSARFSRHWRFLPVGVAGAPTTDNDDYLNALAFAVTSGVVSAKATLHDGDEVIATGANLLAPLASPVFTGKPTSPTPLAAGPAKQVATKKYVDDEAAKLAKVDIAEAIARDEEDVDLGTRVSNEATARSEEDTTLAKRITLNASGVIALANRIDALGGGGGGLIETILFDGKVRGSSSNVLRTLNNGASPPYTDDVVVPETGDLLFMAYIAANGAYAGHFQIPAKEFITRVGVSGATSGQGQSTGFSFPVGQNRAITVTHRVFSAAKRFLWSSSHDVGGTSTEWRLEITHLTPAPPDAGDPSYKPGLAPFRFVGSDRAAAVAAREEYFLGEVALSQAYVDIYSAGNASRIRVTLDPSVTEQVGAAGNAWNLVLGVDHTNTSVTITPNTAAKTFTLRLPDAGIRLDALATDLDSNTRLNAEVVGNGSSLVNYIATWGPNPSSGSTSPFGGGAVQSTTERTAWRANYEADPELVLVLDYGIVEEYQHWNVAVAPIVSDWETVLTLIDPPLPILSAGSSQNLFTGTSRTAAAAARDEYSLRNPGVTQATRLLPLGTSTTQGVLVTLTADAAIGTVGNTWAVVANGAAFAGSNSALTYDVVQQVVGVNYNSANLTAEALAHLFNVTPGFSAELVGGISQRAVGFIAAQIAGAFAGGVNAAFNARTVWIADYDNDSDQYITLSYGQILERQVRRTSMWATVDTIEIPRAVPAGVRLLVHDNAVPGENFQWWQNVTNSAVGQSFIERTGGTIQMETVGSQYLSIPATNSIVYFRISDGTNTTLATLAHLVLPDGSRVASAITVMLGSQPILLTILASGRVVGTRPTVGTTNVGLDAWVQ